MLEINLWDNTFEHLRNTEGNFSMIHGKKNKNLKYLYRKSKHNGITIFTDNFLNPVYINSVKSDIKIGWIIERRELNMNPSFLIDKYIDKLDYLLTNDEEILNLYPEKCIFVPFGGSWIKEENFKIFNKTKNISMIYSNKRGSLPGYTIRHSAAAMLKDKVDFFGTGANRFIQEKEEGVVNYKYSIVVENIKAQNYFTEKLLDCFMVGTIPIYWGCPNIGDFFNLDGIVTFNNLEELESIIDNINDCNIEKENIVNNFELSKSYVVTEDWIYENVLKGILNEKNN